MFKKLFKKEKVTLQKYKPFFVTVDGVRHEGLEYKWAIKEKIDNVPKYFMYDIKSDKYIEDKNGIMYMLNNIISIEWKLIKEKIVEDNFNVYQISVSDDEVN